MKHVIILAFTCIVLAMPAAAQVQRQAKMPRIGLLFTGESSPPSSNVEAFRKGLRDLGYVEGENIALEFRYAEGKLERLPQLASELVRLPVNVIVTATAPAISAARDATSTIPIVFAISGSPEVSGFVQSLARPGGNITGLSIVAADLSAKRLELLKEIAGNASRIAVLWNPDIGDMRSRMQEVQAATKRLKVEVQSLEVRAPDDFARAFVRLSQQRADALFVMADPLTLFHRNNIVERAAALRLPAIYETRDFADAGGLMSYGPDIAENYRRAAVYVNKILKGEKTRDIPVEAPTKFELVVNLRTAKAIGVAIPQSIMLRADKVIQ
jgi:putative ABC transport system substrate-binding protein